MKLKKLLNTIEPQQPIRLVATKGSVTQRSEVIRLDDTYTKPLLQSLGEYKVISLRSVYDELQLPDYQDIIEIKLKGGNDND